MSAQKEPDSLSKQAQKSALLQHKIINKGNDMFNIKTLLAAVLAVAAVAPAFAQGSSAPRIDQRQESQQARIDQGMRSGELTRQEARTLQQEQARINRTERQAKADGVVTRQERQRITKMQKQADRNIAAKKNNKRKASKKYPHAKQNPDQHNPQPHTPYKPKS